MTVYFTEPGKHNNLCICLIITTHSISKLLCGNTAQNYLIPQIIGIMSQLQVVARGAPSMMAHETQLCCIADGKDLRDFFNAHTRPISLKF